MTEYEWEEGDFPARRMRSDRLPDEIHHLIHKLKDNYTFFSEMLEKEIVTFLQLCRREDYGEGQQVFRQGDSARNFYLIISGEVSITVRGGELARLTVGHVFGEMALLESIPRTATATATRRTLAFSVPASVMSAKMPTLAYKVLLSVAQQMSEKLREANAHTGMS